VPTLLIAEGFRFHFFSLEGNEPAHVHVRKGDGKAKFWLEPVALVYARGLKAQEVKRARQIVEQNAPAFRAAWQEHFGD
jgi:hypothetical protein